jgi:hypothetical protein
LLSYHGKTRQIINDGIGRGIFGVVSVGWHHQHVIVHELVGATRCIYMQGMRWSWSWLILRPRTVAIVFKAFGWVHSNGCWKLQLVFHGLSTELHRRVMAMATTPSRKAIGLSSKYYLRGQELVRRACEMPTAPSLVNLLSDKVAMQSGSNQPNVIIHNYIAPCGYFCSISFLRKIPAKQAQEVSMPKPRIVLLYIEY